MVETMTIVICGAVRTPIGKFEGVFKGLSAQQLGSIAIKELLTRTKIDVNLIDEVIMGNVLQAGEGQNPARQAMLFAGLPYEIGAMTLNKVCGSGMKALMIASSEIKADDAKVIIAGGMESMNNAPYILKKARTGYRLGNGDILDAMIYDGLWDVYNNFHMGMTGEIIADKYEIKREEMDKFSFRSHKLAVEAMKTGKFDDEICPVEIPGNGERRIITKDEGPREDTTLEKLGKLRPVFKKDGKITAGNASQISDGASALLVTTEKIAKENGLPIMAKIVSYTTAGTKPELVMEAPIPAVRKLLDKKELKIKDIDLVEHNEAFSSASIAVQRELNIPDNKFNVNGGAIALGHPIGCSGARIVVTLLYEMIKRDAHRGIATACLGGGNATAILIER